MDDRIERARSLAAQASDLTDNADVREQLRSITEGLDRMEGNEERPSQEDPKQEGDRLQQVEEKLAGLTDKTEGTARERVEEARDALDAYRRDDTRDW